jgi:alkylhydroperoxidase/carboxymuconolactone decarboxylase family protein YurZ
MAIDEAAFAAGLEKMREVYAAELAPPGSQKLGLSPFSDETMGTLFARVWSRPGLSMRDRRLLVIAATASLGRADLIEVQVYGALANGELTIAELDEVLLHLAFYVGWPNATAIQTGIRNAHARIIKDGKG